VGPARGGGQKQNIYGPPFAIPPPRRVSESFSERFGKKKRKMEKKAKIARIPNWGRKELKNSGKKET